MFHRNVATLPTQNSDARNSKLFKSVNSEILRKSVKAKWLAYYRENRHWINRLQVWATYEGQRRPTSSFILAVVSTLDPQLTKILPLIVDLNSNPDRIVASLGLNFNPEKELQAIAERKAATPEFKMLPPGNLPIEHPTSRNAAKVDEFCEGVYTNYDTPEGR